MIADINECEEGIANCPTNSNCVNTVGSFACPCNSGFGAGMCDGMTS